METTTIKPKNKYVVHYSAKGFVLGYLWGGGEGAYPSRKVEDKTLKGLLRKATKMLDEGSLDSGMGYESLIGAVLCVRKRTTTIIKNKEFINDDYVLHTIGKLTDEQEDFLIECNIR